MKLKSIIFKAVNVLFIIIIGASLLFLLYLGLRIFAFDSYPVNTGSMIPTIKPGDRIVVNKLIYGARLYKNLDFLKGGKLKTFRLKGVRDINYNDVVVFNRTSPLTFDIRQVYVKRCLGLPGDTIWIKDGRYKNSSIANGVAEKHFTQMNQINLVDTLPNCYPYKEALNWTILNFGPLYMPRKGDHIVLDQTNIWLFLRLMRYESGDDIQFLNDTVFYKDQPIHTYTFKENYYFMAGDNFFNSADSRSFGPIPETFIIGVVPFKITSKLRWERL
ncbi:MAG: signal peptidase I [Prevotellaceae bacterium]|jgi:signal peptidase I|nr:signal peptidase I [Prevotellaceae bacterium]